MGGFIFSVVWTGLSLAMAIIAHGQMGEDDVNIFMIFPAFGLVFMLMTYLSWRRYSSVHTQIVDGETIYVWTEFSGKQAQSETDPRVAWDEASSDGDGGD